jgi:glucose/mannose-6-phosphate isomerase
MNLDDLGRMRSLDPGGMLNLIDDLPAQLERAWGAVAALPSPQVQEVRHVIFAGMGGSAIGADLACVLARGKSAASLTVWRDYGIPAWVEGSESLVVVSSHSGNTEESLDAYHRAGEVRARRVVFTTGGTLMQEAERNGDPAWTIDHPGPPRAAVGYSFGFALGLLARIGLIPDPTLDVGQAVAAMRGQARAFAADSPAVHNPAKRMAGQLVDRWPIFFGAGVLAPVARRWRSQVNELAKAPAQFEELPEADHNAVAGTAGPGSLIGKTMAVFLRAGLDDPRLARRVDATRHLLMVEGYNTDTIAGVGDSLLAQQWTALHYGDYAAYYLAIAYGVDPMPIPAIENLKDLLRG